MYQDNNQKTALCNPSNSQRATQLILHRVLVISRQWAGELPSTSRSGKGEHRRHIITTGQTLSVSTSTFSLHLQATGAYMGRGTPISGLQRRLRGEPDAIVEPDKAGDGVMFTEIGCELFKPKCFRMFQCMEAVVGVCKIGRVSSTKTIVEGLKKLGLVRAMFCSIVRIGVDGQQPRFR